MSRKYKTIELIIPVRPKAKQSVRFSKNRFHKDPKVLQYEKTIQAYAIQQHTGKPIAKTVPIKASVIMSYATKDTKKHGFLKLSVADLDNLYKGLFDSLQDICYINDSQIACYGDCYKLWAAQDFIYVRLEPIEPKVPETVMEFVKKIWSAYNER